jgi:fucose permease
MSLRLLAYVAFISIALPDSLLGVAWPSMRLSLDQPVSALGLVVPFAVVSTLLSSASTGFLLARIGMSRLVTASTALSAAALVGYSVAPAFWMIIAATVLLAAGAGAIDSGLNAYAARHFTARHINWMHASYGVGATVGPLVVTGVIAAGLSWRWSYAFVAAAQAVLAVTFAATSRAWGTGHASDVATPTPAVTRRGSRRNTLRLGAVWRGAAIFALQTGFESATTLWAYLFLTEGRGVAAPAAGLTVSAYWAALFVGRLVLGPLADHYGSQRVLTGGVAGISVGAILVALPAPTAVAIGGFIVIGLAAAPMFPLLTLTTRERVGTAHADQTVGVQVAASSLGASTIPAVVGLLIGRFGTGALGPCLVVLALATAAAYAFAARWPAAAQPLAMTPNEDSAH